MLLFTYQATMITVVIDSPHHKLTNGKVKIKYKIGNVFYFQIHVCMWKNWFWLENPINFSICAENPFLWWSRQKINNSKITRYFFFCVRPNSLMDQYNFSGCFFFFFGKVEQCWRMPSTSYSPISWNKPTYFV